MVRLKTFCRAHVGEGRELFLCGGEIRGAVQDIYVCAAAEPVLVHFKKFVCE